jgi:hypothetical protein
MAAAVVEGKKSVAVVAEGQTSADHRIDLLTVSSWRAEEAGVMILGLN